MVLGCHDHEQNTERKRRFFNFRKGTEILKEGIWAGLFSAASQTGDQYYDVIILIASLRYRWKQTGPNSFLQDFCAFSEIKKLLFAVSIWDVSQYAVTSRCSSIYGGLVIPSLNIAPSGMTSISFHSNSGSVWPMSRPYAPVSSDVNHSSTTPSRNENLLAMTTVYLGTVKHKNNAKIRIQSKPVNTSNSAWFVGPQYNTNEMPLVDYI